MNYFLGFAVGVFVCLLFEEVSEPLIKTTKQKPTIDYKLEGNGKQIDTIWIYNFKKH